MADDLNRNHAPVPQDGGVPVTPNPTPAALDANGFDPAAFEWRPVPRRPRRDGWTPEVQQRFIEALARTGVVERACEAVNMSVTSAYNLRNSAGGEGFARAWHEVLARAANRVLDIAFEHAIEGEEVPIFDRDGVRVGAKRRYDTRMAMFILRAYFPERFRHAHQDRRAGDEPAPPPAVPVAGVIEALAPVPPAEPHLLATPERLDDMVHCAEALANHDANFATSDREPYRPQRAPDPHPRVADRASRNRTLRQHREERQDEALGLNFPSTSEREPPRDPLSDFTYWAEAERRRLAGEAEPDAAEEFDLYDGDDAEEDDFEGADESHGKLADEAAGMIEAPARISRAGLNFPSTSAARAHAGRAGTPPAPPRDER